MKPSECRVKNGATVLDLIYQSLIQLMVSGKGVFNLEIKRWITERTKGAKRGDIRGRFDYAKQK